MTGGSAPMLQAARLWEKTSAAGNVYLVGRLGGVRVLILRNRAAGTEGEPDWNLFFVDGSDKPRQAASESGKPTSGSHRGLYAAPRRPGSGPDLPDDGINDLWPESAP
jgi:hypothetical protein